MSPRSLMVLAALLLLPAAALAKERARGCSVGSNAAPLSAWR